MSSAPKPSKKEILLVAVLSALVLVFIWGRDAESAEVALGISTGLPTTHSDGIRAQEIQIRTNDYRWYLSYTRIGANANERLQLRQNDRWAAGYTVTFRRDKVWKPFISIGAAYFKQPPMDLISERLTYDLRLGIRFKDIVELELDNHNSTASRSDKNTGLDLIGIRLVFQF